LPASDLKLEAKQRTKRKLKKETPNARIWLVGSRTWKNKKLIKSVLSQFDYRTVDFVLLGTSPGLEQLALTVCRQLKFNCLVLPPNVSRDGINAIYFRNAINFVLLKPTHVFGFYDDLDLDERAPKSELSQKASTRQLLKLAKEKKIEWKLLTTNLTGLL
jgi:hypothetical protein